MKANELRGKKTEELQTLLAEKMKEAFNLRFQKTTGELEKTSRIREVRRDIARINTLINENKAA